MFCTKCGQIVPDGTSFCTNCGAKLGNAAGGAGQPMTPQRPVGGQSGYGAPAGPAFGVIKSACSSPVALIAAIAYTVTTIIGIISAFNGVSPALEVLNNSMYTFGAGDIVQEMGGLITFFTILCLLPSIFMTIGLWLTYVSASDSLSPLVKTNGLSMLKVVLNVLTVLMIVGGAALEILLMVVLAGASDYLGSYMTGYIIGAMLALAALFVVCIIGYLKASGLVRDMKNTALTGAPYRVSAYLGVYAFILGGLSIIQCFDNEGALMIISCLSSAAASIAFGVFVFSYRSQMNLLLGPAGYAAPAMNNGAYRQQGYNAAQGAVNGYGQPVSYARPVQQPQAQPSSYAQPRPVAQPQPAVQPQPAAQSQPVAQPQPAAVEPASHGEQIVTCESCGNSYEAKYQFCPHCGNERKQ